MKALFDIVAIIKKVNPHIIHSWADTTSFYSILAKPIVKCKFKLIDGSVRNAQSKFYWFHQKSVLRRFINRFADVIVANSKAGLKEYNVPTLKNYFIYNGFDMNRISTIQPASEIRTLLGIKTTYAIGMVGRIDFEKDYPTYIQAANKILNKRRDITFLIVGDGIDMDRIKSLCDINYSTNFIFTGQISNVESIINCFDIGVLATFTEGISNSIMEYMALSKPVIATEGGGTPELIINGTTGILVTMGNVEELADNIELLINNIALRRNMGVNGKKRIEEEFGFNKMIDKYVNLYMKQLNY